MMQAGSTALQTGTAPPSAPVWLERWKDGAAATASTFTVVSLVVGGVWGYVLFVRRRQRFPRANVEHLVMDWPVEGGRLVRAVVRVKNLGEVIVRVAKIRAAVTQLVPIPPDVASAVAEGRDPVDRDSSEILWDTLGDRHRDFSGEGCEVEPAETEEFIFDFIIPRDVTKVQVYTHVENVQKWKKNIGWNTTTVYDIGQRTSNGNEGRKDVVPGRTGTP